MANIQIGKYKRPGIFIEEFDQSVISSPIVEGITNLVIGVSKKGPFNTPIKLTTTNDLEAIFGQLDRNLERKGSFFHRTISKMLETSPIYAMNLLLTDDTLDAIEYKSISSSSGFDNDVKREGPYRRFFDTTGFWKRDTESFINLTKENTGYAERAFSLTNLSDKPVTTFVFKSALSGFDRTLLEWYGTIDKMPPFVNANDYASDYMVDVVVISGDWSNYQSLAVDPRWSQYFNASGLIKEEVSNFANDRNINLLTYYEGLSLIPYFRDLNGTNVFIETSLNRDTDKTGLFCAFNNDLVEVDYYNGMLDLLGNTIVGENETNIDFISYKELISEQIEITATPLDLPGNVTAILGGSASSYIDQSAHAFGSIPLEEGIVTNGDNRTAWFGEGSVYDVTRTSYTGTSGTMSIVYTAGANAFAVIGDEKIDITAEVVTLEIFATDYPILSTTASYFATAVLNDSGEIVLNTTITEDTYPTVTASDIVLGYVEFDIVSNVIASSTYTHLTINDSGFIGLVNDTDYEVSDEGSGKIKIEFSETATIQDVNNYEQYRKFKMFNRLVNLLDSTNIDRMAMSLGGSDGSDRDKYRLEDSSVLNIVTATYENKSFELQTTLESGDLTYIVDNGYLVIYTIDDETILGSEGMITKNTVATATQGVVAENSLLYSRFYDGMINTGDFFYDNRLYTDSTGATNDLLGDTVTVDFIDGEDATGSPTSSYAGYDYIIFGSDEDFASEVGLLSLDKILIPDSVLNTGTFTIQNDVATGLAPAALAVALGFTGSDYYAYQVTEEVETETLFGVNLVYDYNAKYYLKMYLTGTDLDIEFVDVSVNVEANNTIFIQSRKSNLKQSIEIEVPTGYTRVHNKILVDATRYTELGPGNFLEAYVDTDELEIGEVPRKLTRILSKKRYAGDATLSEITCDSRIKVYNFGGDLQTLRYVSIDNYVSTYKAITLKGFKVRTNSLPDGSEDRQDSILNLVAKGTPMFKALTNKEAIDFRYLIDSFGLGLTERSKQQLVDICGTRLDLFGFINMPSLRDFKNSSSPSFVDSEGILQTEFIAEGGDPESNPAFLYSFADGAGVTTVGYFTPYLTVNDNGRPLDMPPASYVATTYMRKHISNVTSITPWTIAAGVTNGKITNISGLEMDFTYEDIENLNQAQMNPIVYKRNRGYIIETENTAQTLYKSALSYIHVREVLVELERELSRMLLDYQWKYNTPDIRAEIKLRADVICETYVSKNGLYNYFNKMDDENNTSEIIDNQMGVLDTYVEPIKGMGIIVNNITILRTGAISAGGFINS